MTLKLAYLIIITFFTSLASFALDTNKLVSEMTIVGFKGTDIYDQKNELVVKQLKEGAIGGIIIYGYNIESPNQLNTLIKNIKSISIKKIFVAIDQEGGKIQRLKKANGFTNYFSHEYIAQTLTPKKAEKYYLNLAEELKSYGINLNFGPVVDILDKNSPVIGGIERSFSSDTSAICNYASSFISAHRNSSIITSLKHFPGHGSAATDTHKSFTDISDTWSNKELQPYKCLIKRMQADSIMSAHVFHKGIDKNLPASLSKKHLRGILRDQLGFDGVIFSDDLQMGAIRKNYDLKTAVVKAIQAGTDVLVFSNYFYHMPEFPEKAKEYIKEAIKNGELRADELEKSYERILKLKERYIK